MAAFGHTNTDVQIEAHSLRSLGRAMAAEIVPVPLNSAKIVLQESGITKEIQPPNGKMADLNSKIENGGGTKVKKLHLRPKRKKVPLKRGAQPGNQNAYKHGNYTRERRAFYAEIRAHIQRGRALIEFAKAVTAIIKARRTIAPASSIRGPKATLLRDCSMSYSPGFAPLELRRASPAAWRTSCP
jgi:hypothetical protein